MEFGVGERVKIKRDRIDRITTLPVIRKLLADTVWTVNSTGFSDNNKLTLVTKFNGVEYREVFYQDELFKAEPIKEYDNKFELEILHGTDGITVVMNRTIEGTNDALKEINQKINQVTEDLIHRPNTEQVWTEAKQRVLKVLNEYFRKNSIWFVD